MKIGAPNSIARYVSERQWGEWEFCVMAYLDNRPICVVAGKKELCEKWMRPDYFLIDLSTYFPKTA